MIKKYFTNAAILLCIFHVFKYLKNNVISKLVIKIEEKSKINEMFRSLVYAKDEVIFEEIKTKLKEGTNNIVHSTKTVNDATVSLYEYIEKNWLNCKEMWVTMYRKNLNTFGSNTNNHIEAFHRSIKLRIAATMHIYETLIELMKIVSDIRAKEITISHSLKQRNVKKDDCPLVRKFHKQLSLEAVKKINAEYQVLEKNSYSMNEIKTNEWDVFVNKNNLHRVTKNINLRCECAFYSQNELPCPHIMHIINLEYELDFHDDIAKLVNISSKWCATDINNVSFSARGAKKTRVFLDTLLIKLQKVKILI